MILGLRTDKPEAELFLIEGEKIVDSLSWLAHRELSDTLLHKIEALVSSNAITPSDLRAVIAYQGPGSFTGLRIGLSVANALAYALNIPVIAAKGESWQSEALKKLRGHNIFKEGVVPHYGSEAHITAPRK